MRIASLCALLLLVAAPAACGGDDDDDDGSTAIDAAPGSGIDAGDDGGDDADAAPGVDGGDVRLCGGLAGLQCNDDEYCDWKDDACGSDPDSVGTCLARPTECEPGGEVVCGCDQQRYDNKCLAAMAGQDVPTISICN